MAVVLTMRSDFLGACAAFPQLAAVLSAHQELVGPMTAAELREAIERPAFLVGCEVEPGLTERLLADVKGQSGALPLLQFALTEVWKKRDVRRLTLRAYDDLGGSTGALEQRAERDLSQPDARGSGTLPPALPAAGAAGGGDRGHQAAGLVPRAAARRPGAGRGGPQADPDPGRPRRPADHDRGDGRRRRAVEVAHEALIRGWTQLREWIEAERAGLRTQRRLTEAAQEWAVADPEHKEDYLYSGRAWR